MNIKKLIGDRIYLSPKCANQEEVEIFTKWMNDNSITDYTGRTGQITTLLGEKDYLENTAKGDFNRDFNIVLLDNDQLIGTIGLQNINWIERSAVLGIFIGESDYRSNGYGSEAIKLILDLGFNYLNLHSVGLEMLSENERGHKCYLKCGFKDTGRDREKVFLNGKYYDLVRMDILDREFTEEYIRNKEVK